MKISIPRLVIVLLLFALTFVLLQNVSGVHRTPIKQTLSNFPVDFGGLQAVSSRESSEGVIKLLGVDDYIEYNYTAPGGQRVNFYAAYYEAVGSGSGYHSPKNCIPGGGWGIDAVNAVKIVPEGRDNPVAVSEMIIRNRNEYQVVYYWYQNRGRIIASEYWEKVYLVFDAITKKRRDGTFVRIMASAPEGDIGKARQSLQQFASLAVVELENFLPGE